MDFQTAVRTVYVDKYADFSGRARRSEFWFGYLGYVIAAIVVSIIGAAIHFPALVYILFLAVVVPILAAAARRLHDTGRSAWWLLLYFTIIGGVVLLVWYIFDTKPGPNQYGPAPKEAYGPYGGAGTGGWEPPTDTGSGDYS